MSSFVTGFAHHCRFLYVWDITLSFCLLNQVIFLQLCEDKEQLLLLLDYCKNFFYEKCIKYLCITGPCIMTFSFAIGTLHMIPTLQSFVGSYGMSFLVCLFFFGLPVATLAFGAREALVHLCVAKTQAPHLALRCNYKAVLTNRMHLY